MKTICIGNPNATGDTLLDSISRSVGRSYKRLLNRGFTHREAKGLLILRLSTEAEFALRQQAQEAGWVEGEHLPYTVLGVPFDVGTDGLLKERGYELLRKPHYVGE